MISTVLCGLAGIISYLASVIVLVKFLKDVPSRLEKVKNKIENGFFSEDDILGMQYKAYHDWLLLGDIISLSLLIVYCFCFYFYVVNRTIKDVVITIAVFLVIILIFGCWVFMEYFYRRRIEKSFDLIMNSNGQTDFPIPIKKENTSYDHNRFLFSTLTASSLIRRISFFYFASNAVHFALVFCVFASFFI